MTQRKAQIYIITTVFLAAMIFSIHSLLLAYSNIDLAGSTQTSDAYIIENIEQVFQDSLDSSQDCLEAQDNVIELKETLKGIIRSGYELSLSGDLDCPGGDWPPSGPDLTLDVKVVRESGETLATLELDHN
jgi:hypothetical protein